MMKSDTIPFIFACIGFAIMVAALAGLVANGGMYAALGFLILFGGVIGMAKLADQRNERDHEHYRNVRVGAPHNRRRAEQVNELDALKEQAIKSE